jgi:hypothetical protein
MNINDFEIYCNKLNVMLEVKTFKKLEKVHKKQGHESKDCFCCETCCLMADDIMYEYLSKNHEQKQIEETIKDLEQKEKLFRDNGDVIDV